MASLSLSSTFASFLTALLLATSSTVATNIQFSGTAYNPTGPAIQFHLGDDNLKPVFRFLQRPSYILPRQPSKKDFTEACRETESHDAVARWRVQIPCGTEQLGNKCGENELMDFVNDLCLSESLVCEQCYADFATEAIEAEKRYGFDRKQPKLRCEGWN